MRGYYFPENVTAILNTPSVGPQQNASTSNEFSWTPAIIAAIVSAIVLLIGMIVSIVIFVKYRNKVRNNREEQKQKTREAYRQTLQAEVRTDVSSGSTRNSISGSDISIASENTVHTIVTAPGMRPNSVK